ncbi:hypothetical protein VIN30_09970 [Adlercreutzia sp. R7]|uniref:Plasmid pRiA4b Orf3-like domain-containing protein n=1 Tax=Adlercreutzia wanghongyangiae TaxID=3111451 RepID=A0ABU6IK06_9ACTN|nr:hypothetical protein [Adlercreutzia sp. R7]
MAAKIIPFPADCRAAAQGTARSSEGDANIALVVELVDPDPSRARTHAIAVQPDASLADLHREITRHFDWDATHNYFFSYGSCRFEDPELFRGHDHLSARCRKIYSAAEASIGRVLGARDDTLFYVYDLVHGWEVRISRKACSSLAQFG